MKLKTEQTEKSIMLSIVQALSFKDWKVIRMPPSIYSGQKGIPDLYAIKWGISVWIEVKSARGKMSPTQKQFAERIEDAGGIYILARNVDFVLKVLDELEIVICDPLGNPVQSFKPCKGMRLMSGGKA